MRPCSPQGEIFESVHELATQEMLSHLPLGAISRILVIALVLGKDRLTTLPRAIGTYLLAFFRVVKAFNPGDRSTDIAEHRLAYLFPGM